MDASGFEHNTKLDYGWIRKGKKRWLPSNTGRKRLNVNGAYNPVTQETITVYQDIPMNAGSNIDLIIKVLEANSSDINRFTFILDNASMNRSRELLDFISEVTRDCGYEIELKYLPTYSPNLNLIERFWGFAKRKLLSNMYYATYTGFYDRIVGFLENEVSSYCCELRQLMTERFQRLGIS